MSPRLTPIRTSLAPYGRRHRTLLLLPAVILASVLSGCGDSPTQPANPSPPKPVTIGPGEGAPAGGAPEDPAMPAGIEREDINTGD
jgi:hypothetical protein